MCSEGSNLMKQTNRTKYDNNFELLCPVCGMTTGYRTDGQVLGPPIDVEFLPQPGDLTECDNCDALLTFGGHEGVLRLLRCSPTRAESFNALAREHSNCDLSTLVKYAMEYRQMPANLTTAGQPIAIQPESIAGVGCCSRRRQSPRLR